MPRRGIQPQGLFSKVSSVNYTLQFIWLIIQSHNVFFVSQQKEKVEFII